MTRMAHCAWTLKTMWFVLNIYFPSWDLEFWCLLSRGCLLVQLPVKTLVSWPLISFPCAQPFVHLVTIPATCRVSREAPKGEDSSTLSPDFLQILPMHLSPLLILRCILLLWQITAMGTTTVIPLYLVSMGRLVPGPVSDTKIQRLKSRI